MVDIYFESEYGRIHEKFEQGKSTIFKFENEYGKIQHMFIKRRIKNTEWYDLITPYGYGGPLIKSYKDGYKNKLIKEFNKKFQIYCEENNIVSEFVRFHPVIKNALDFKSVYSIDKIRKTIGTNIQDYEDPVANEFSKSTRKTIRRALRSGLKYRVIENPNSLHNFKEIYYSTMDRNKASGFYYFDEHYFNSFLEYFNDSIILVEVLYEDKIIACGFYLVYNNFVHAHLSGTLTDYLKFSPAYIIKYATVEWAIENKIKLIHYGGGTSNDEEDPLFKFKKKFGQNTEFDFYIGKKIWNNNVYNQLCKMNNIDKDIDFFPAYRYES